MSADAFACLANGPRSKNPVPVEHLDYAYIDKCDNAKEVERILRVLRSGEEGCFPHLTEFCERRLVALAPQSRALWVDRPAPTAASLPPEERAQLLDALQEWSDEMRKREEAIKSTRPAEADAFMGALLPPVRNVHDKISVEKSVKKDIHGAAERRIRSVDYKAWDRYDVEGECARLDAADGEGGDPRPPAGDEPTRNPPDLALALNTVGMSAAELAVRAEKEKEKGNDAFRAGDFAEALAYYTRSIAALPTAACYNNRALAHIKRAAWDDALRDCNTVLGLEPNNIKALLRRALVHRERGRDASARSDLLTVLELDQHNTQAQTLLRKLTLSVEGGDDGGCRVAGVLAAGQRGTAPTPTLGPEGERPILASHPESSSLGKKRVTLQIEMEDDEGDEDLAGAQPWPSAAPSVTQHADAVTPTAASSQSNEDSSKCAATIATTTTTTVTTATIATAATAATTATATAATVTTTTATNAVTAATVAATTTTVTAATVTTTATNTATAVTATTAAAATVTAFGRRSGADRRTSGEAVPLSAYEFGQRWSRLGADPNAGAVRAAADLLSSVGPDRLPLVSSNLLEGADVALVARAVERHVLPGEPGTAFRYLQRLTRAPRFQVACSFLTSSEKEAIRNAMKQLRRLSSGTYSQGDVHILEEQYGI
ncbi:sperm-associated antigen 1 [Lethenteron reissneri]|uniref:sperm-associated antigen 1 n=1 Tax=Lethenteron reissneri TaxID=7753 RepID=UPI002AB7D19C|nr:sperm-associated antigen 1 [Lethenteron reissneri]